ncbi:MAG: hypothetical protein DMD96_33075 [Candidatus Rokuibacteriota bacterium]|nr:MAG: hypothetical protein DMD96_33075 [Candidatus Rokubacteria bacterium]
MTGRGDIWATLAGAAAIILFVVNVVLVERNRSLQGEINLRQQFIQQSVQLEALNRDLISAIANLSVRNKDEQLKTILTQQGITFNVAPSLPGPTAPSATRPASAGDRR